MTPDTNQTGTIAFLAGLAGAPPVETHISSVFLGRDTVWKLKKAVRLPFLDFSTLESRKHFCERELELNRPAAPLLYRDVAPVVRRPDGTIALGGDGEVLDWVVRMARVPAGDFLDARAACAPLPPEMLDAIADAVALWHLSLPPLPGVHPDLAGIADGNAMAGLAAGLNPVAVEAWRVGLRARLAANAAWHAARANEGFVRRCHGDLHLGNLCLWQGRPVPFDALEFDEALATTDLSYDLAFLLMDMEQRQDRAAANRVLNRYVARTGDTGLVGGLPEFLSMRAAIRAHAQVSPIPVEGRLARRGAAPDYLDAAALYLTPRAPVCVAVGGLPGTGKSTLARALAPLLGRAPGALVLRSDEIRKRQHGLAPEQRLPASAYTPAKSVAVFDALVWDTAAAVQVGQAVIADAMFMSHVHRDMVERAAGQTGVPFVGLWLMASAETLERRVAARRGDASDATVAVLRAAAKNDPGPGAWHAIDASDASLALALAKTILSPHMLS